MDIIQRSIPSFRLDLGCIRQLSGCCAFILILFSGCSFGPRHLLQTRIPYNDAVKKTSEQQLLLNLVRLRYVDTPSSLAISAIADQQEVAGGVQATPFFTSAATGDAFLFRGSVLPQIGWNRASRPTLSYTPMDDEEFTRRLFTPISLDGVAYLSNDLAYLHRLSTLSGKPELGLQRRDRKRSDTDGPT
jgi:hypothetical protein